MYGHLSLTCVRGQKSQDADGWILRAVRARRADANSGSRACTNTNPLPLRLTAGVSSHLLQVFHRKLCARKSSLREQP
jgi:hypothetical protein